MRTEPLKIPVWRAEKCYHFAGTEYNLIMVFSLSITVSKKYKAMYSLGRALKQLDVLLL